MVLGNKWQEREKAKRTKPSDRKEIGKKKTQLKKENVQNREGCLLEEGG